MSFKAAAIISGVSRGVRPAAFGRAAAAVRTLVSSTGPAAGGATCARAEGNSGQKRDAATAKCCGTLRKLILGMEIFLFTQRLFPLSRPGTSGSEPDFNCSPPSMPPHASAGPGAVRPKPLWTVKVNLGAADWAMDFLLARASASQRNPAPAVRLLLPQGIPNPSESCLLNDRFCLA